MKKFVLLLLVVVIGIELYRRRAAPGGPGWRQRGTPDHWPPVVRKPAATRAPTANQPKAPSAASR
ncbi:MAG: hypothetical protein ACYCSX_12755 [Acidimicrobiales bacterium]